MFRCVRGLLWKDEEEGARESVENLQTSVEVDSYEEKGHRED